jgi:hypothetical protein
MPLKNRQKHMSVGLPNIMTTTHGLLVVADKDLNDLFTYCPHFGVMRGLGNFDDNPRLFTPSYLQLFTASPEDIQRMQKEWSQAARKNTRFIGRVHNAAREDLEPDAPLPYIPALGEPSFLADIEDYGVQALEEFELVCMACDEIDAEIAAQKKTAKPATKVKDRSKTNGAKGKASTKKSNKTRTAHP